jgi:sugar lactone lactonase YvrE
VDPGTPQLLIDGLRFPEGLHWRNGELWFTDIQAQSLLRLDRDGDVRLVARFPEHVAGVGFLPDGTPLTAGMETATVYAVDGQDVSVYVELREEAGGNIDDLVVTDGGSLYVGGIGVMAENAPPTGGTMVHVAPDRSATRVAEGLLLPNGMRMTPQGTAIIVSETHGQRLMEFEVGTDGSLGAPHTWAPLPGLHPDSLCLDAEGCAWVACYQENSFVRVAPGGEITDRLSLPAPQGPDNIWTAGVELGGPDGHTLYMSSAYTNEARYFRGDTSAQIYSIRVAVPCAEHVG